MSGKHWFIVIIILVAGYGIYNGLNDLLKSSKKHKQWTSNDRVILINKCIEESGPNGIKYPELTKNYCECSNDKIMGKFIKQDYLELINKPTDVQIKILLPIFKDCLTEYQNAIKQATN